MSEIKEMVARAFKEKWAVGHFNIPSLEAAQGISLAAERSSGPVIIGTANGTIEHLGLDYVRMVVEEVRRHARGCVFIHMDHGTSEQAHYCIDAGWDSVMIDASELPYDENVRITQEVVEHARRYDVAVEAQIGKTWEPDDERFGEDCDTHPDEAERFVADTGIDWLAVSIGNNPGAVDVHAAPIQLDTLKEIERRCGVPIVMHGGTNVGDDAMRGSIQLGVAKVNIDTAIRYAVTESIKGYYADNPSVVDIRPGMADARERVAQVVADKMKLFGSCGRI
jgi:ketose-bisphosphate aldolase